MPIQVKPDGPCPARVMIVGEAPGEWEERQGIPFVGPSGGELNKMLQEVGLTRSECFVTNVCRIRPPKNDIGQFIAKAKKDITPAHRLLRDKWVLPPVIEGYELLKKEIQNVQPNIIIPVGNVSMWALTGKWGITKWRGSMLSTDSYFHGPINTTGFTPVKCIPTYHPAAVLRQWSWRAITVNDLRRAKRFRDGADYPRPKWNFTIRPSFDQAVARLRLLIAQADRSILRLAFDIETRHGHIACAGIAWSLTDALCIPFMCVERPDGYWSVDQETYLVWLLQRLLTHPQIRVVGQNIIYDCQYTWRHWHWVPRVAQDTMIGQHALWSDLPKALAFICSMYCNYYVYWKDEGKDWDPSIGEASLWYYNCEDNVYTLEAANVEESIADSMGLRAVYDAQQEMFWPVLQAMQRGVAIDQTVRKDLIEEVNHEIDRREKFLAEILGHSINPRSPKQMMALFYEDLQLPVQMTRATKDEPARPTLNDDALNKLVRIQPLVKPLVNAILDIRTLGVFLSNFLERPLDIDGRMRCAYNIGGSESGKSAPKTYRLSSSENAFGSGGNLQNIPSEKSKSLGKAAARGGIPALGDPYQFPNIRSMFVPDSGYVWFDGDLDRADLQVVVWEADDAMLKAALRMGADIHLLNSFVLIGKEPPPIEELVETHSKYRDHRGPMKLIREFAKVFCHGTNYGGKPPTMAANTGRTVHEIDRAQKIWFGAHPGILRWHERIKTQVSKFRFVENRFGYRWYIFDRIDSIIPEAIAWIPQSTVSIVINRIWMNLYRNLPQVQVLLQVHDSLCGQIPADMVSSLVPQMLTQARIVVPYEDPLTIPFSLKTSARSWGDVK